MFNKTILKDVFTLAFPAIGEMILYMIIWIFDTMMVGKYSGNIGVSSVGMSSEIMYTCINVFIAMGISIGITSLVARNYGAKKYNTAEEYSTLGLAVGTFIAFIISIFLFTCPSKILKLAGSTDEVIFYGTMYLKITSFGAFFAMITNILNSILRAYGNTKTPLLVSIIINIINIILDSLLIFGYLGFPELGIKGSAIATTIAQIAGFIFIFIYFTKKSKIKPRAKYIKNIEMNKLKDIIKLSVPSSMQEGSVGFSRLLSAFIIMNLGTISFASNQITTTIESLSFMPGWGLSLAATTLVGHKIGEQNIEKAKKYAYTCTIIGIIIMSLCSLLFLIFPTFLISLFINESEKEVIKLGSTCLMIAAIEQPFISISMILGGSLKGLGDTKSPFIVSLISNWLIRLPLMYYFIYILKLSVTYVWLITSIQWFIDAILIIFIFKRKFKI